MVPPKLRRKPKLNLTTMRKINRKKDLPWLIVALLLFIGFVALSLAAAKKQEQAEEMAKLRNDMVIADTEWPEGWSGSRKDSILFAKIQDKERADEEVILRNTSWPSYQRFADRADSLRFAKAQDEQERNAKEEEQRRREEERRRVAEEQRRRASFTWSTTYFVNEWGERSGNGAKSRQHGPVTQMSWPYNDVEAQILVQCSGPMTWIRFTTSPNLTNDETMSGYNVSNLPVRLDGQSTRWRTTQSWGDNDINLPKSAIDAFKRSKTFEIVLPWYGEGNVRFKWDLTGSSEMISEACG